MNVAAYSIAAHPEKTTRSGAPSFCSSANGKSPIMKQRVGHPPSLEQSHVWRQKYASSNAGGCS